MRLLIFSDIHGNLPAFEALLAEARRLSPDAYLCLGDVAAMGAWPRECLDLLRSLNCPVVMGNADEDLIEPRAFAPQGFPDEREIHDLDTWAREQLTEQDLAFVRTFQPTVELDLGGVELLAFHGSPASCREVIGAETPETRLAELRAIHGDAPLWVGGHTHLSLLRRLPGWTLLNPGTVGLAFEQREDQYVNVARAEFLVLDVNGGKVQFNFRFLPYDVEAVRVGIRSRGMPHAEWWAKEWQAD